MIRKLVFLTVLAFAFCMIFTGCGPFGDEVPKEKIVEYVNQNHEMLESVTECDIPIEQDKEEAFILDHLGKQKIVKSIYRYNDNNVDFYCGGTGLSTNSTYCGFIYSADDTPFAKEFPTDELEETSYGVYEWKSDTGEEIITERIMPKWFYYHMVWY
ncbi:MAG: hypothetical protein ACSW8G_02225 [Bacillota bacterium]